ncbi:hypothetical protein PVK06_029678 [Gossypium arboreum]|uniref:GDSL esterase/lipase 7-like n=1 Tax=Gossypium arboreum TaxID=29729 RepID=A0ABR0NL71_GOSAR|nr:hypothetical protein PVK06_029678 [Gossypium arboreum]
MKHLSLVDIKIALPAIYVFGDSFIDNVNNKAVLGNKDAIEGGYLPFGIDFDGKPTGQVTNGRIGVDFIATVAGLPYPPPIMGNDLGLTFEVEMAKKYSIDKYAELLIKEFSKQLKRLYTLGGRKFFVSNVSPLGCSPFSINTKNHSGPCVEEINNRVSFYNNLLPSLLKNLQSTLSGSKFVLGDIYKVFKDVFEMPESYGFKYVKTSCCIDNNGTKIQVCTLNIALCKDRKSRVFFDPFYPSETMYFLWARRFLKDSSVCSPINLIQLMQA